MGIRARCEAAALANAASGKAADAVSCSAKLQAAFAKAEARGGCATSNDAATIQNQLTAITSDAARTLSGVRFIDDGDGTVTDTSTGLQWQQAVTVDGLTWSKPCDPDTAEDFQCRLEDGDAFLYLDEQLNQNSNDTDGSTISGPSLAGHTDWRLPTIAELRTLVDLAAPGCGAGSPCTDPVFVTLPVPYWSSTRTVAQPDLVWLVDFGSGTVSSDSVVALHAVRAVRRGR